ncbi:MAG: nucleic acid-binding protein [Methanomassiliicoccales archaeon]
MDVENKERLVLDTSALFSMQDLPYETKVHTTPGVIRELERYGDRRAELWGDLLEVSEPSVSSKQKVKDAASRTGDISRLSPTDVEVLALAIDLEAILLTDDYSLQNLAAYLGIPYRPVGLKGIKNIRRWRWRCLGCGKIFENPCSECPICGSRIRSSLSKRD